MGWERETDGIVKVVVIGAIMLLISLYGVRTLEEMWNDGEVSDQWAYIVNVRVYSPDGTLKYEKTFEGNSPHINFARLLRIMLQSTSGPQGQGPVIDYMVRPDGTTFKVCAWYAGNWDQMMFLEASRGDGRQALVVFTGDPGQFNRTSGRPAGVVEITRSYSNSVSASWDTANDNLIVTMTYDVTMPPDASGNSVVWNITYVDIVRQMEICGNSPAVKNLDWALIWNEVIPGGIQASTGDLVTFTWNIVIP